MGCNCGKNSQAFVYVYQSPKGVTTKYATEIEAKAAQIRNGGGQYETQAK